MERTAMEVHQLLHPTVTISGTPAPSPSVTGAGMNGTKWIRNG